jgi:ribosomal protein L31
VATVIVEMRTCDETHRVTVTAREDGDFDVDIRSDCQKIEAYGSRLGKISLTDIIDLDGSCITSSEMRQDISSNCLSVMGVINAGWIEAGMLSRTLVSKISRNSLRFTDDDGGILQ